MITITNIFYNKLIFLSKMCLFLNLKKPKYALVEILNDNLYCVNSQ